ncbi:MAG: nucleotidyltransferase family protein [Pseudomonadota bacterium]
MPVEAAMIFAAGFGTRMRDLTKDMPKPMLPVAGRPMIDHALDHVFAAGISQAVVNTHYLAPVIEAHLKGRPNVTTLREEPDVLETGGGLRNALPQLGSGPVVTMNPDAIFIGPNPVEFLLSSQAGNAATLLLLPRHKALSHGGRGDFDMDASRTLSWRDGEAADYIYTGVQLIDPKGLQEIPEKKFSLRLLWEKYMEDDDVKGVVYPGSWIDVGTPEGLASADAELARQ